MAIRLRKYIKKWLRENGYEFRKLGKGELDDITRLVRIAERYQIEHIIDIGANEGQFAIDLRVAGYCGNIYSVEPLKQAHERLLENAKRDTAWHVCDRIAIGSKAGEAIINVSMNSYSSSLLPMKDNHIKSAPDSTYIDTQFVKVITLDDLVSILFGNDIPSILLKLDTQGYEYEVINGGRSSLNKVFAIFTELSLVPLYVGAPEFGFMYKHVLDEGYHCVALSHEFSDSKTGSMLQVNGTFVRKK